MARPKSDDPTVAVPIRLKRSAYEWWSTHAGGNSVAKTLQSALEGKAEKERRKALESAELAEAAKEDNGARIVQTIKSSPAMNKARAAIDAEVRRQVRKSQPDVTPRFKGGK